MNAYQFSNVKYDLIESETFTFKHFNNNQV